jgi:hypothetical protein
MVLVLSSIPVHYAFVNAPYCAGARIELSAQNAAPKPNACRLAPAQRPQPDLNMDKDQLDSGDNSVFDLRFSSTRWVVSKALEQKYFIVPTLQRGNAFRTAPAVRNLRIVRARLKSSCKRSKRSVSGYTLFCGDSGRWSVYSCIPTLERGND